MTIGILQYAGVIFIVIWIGAILKKNSEMMIGLLLAVSLLLLEMMTQGLSGFIRMLNTLADQAGLDSGSLRIIVKILGIGYVADICARLCKDQGMDSLSFQIENAGKILVIIEAVPVIEKLIRFMSDLMQ